VPKRISPAELLRVEADEVLGGGEDLAGAIEKIAQLGAQTAVKLSGRDRRWFDLGGQEVVIAGDDHRVGCFCQCDQVVVVWVAYSCSGWSSPGSSRRSAWPLDPPSGANSDMSAATPNVVRS
jgi:hypothetical protein